MLGVFKDLEKGSCIILRLDVYDTPRIFMKYIREILILQPAFAESTCTISLSENAHA